MARKRRGPPAPARPDRWTQEAWNAATFLPDSMHHIEMWANPPIPDSHRERFDREFERLMKPVRTLARIYYEQTGDPCDPDWEYCDFIEGWNVLRRQGVLARIGMEIVEFVNPEYDEPRLVVRWGG